MVTHAVLKRQITSRCGAAGHTEKTVVGTEPIYEHLVLLGSIYQTGAESLPGKIKR